jgi:uncharacterized protein with FMN-binding domain
MRRYHLVLGGTVAGIAGILAFPTHSAHLTIPAASTGPTPSAATSAPSTTAAPPSTTVTSPSADAPTSGSPPTSPTTSAVRTATSAAEQYPYGDLSVTVTVTGSKITNVKIATLNDNDSRSASIDDYAVPQLEQQVISAGSAKINGISGATFTSQAFVDGVANALQKLGLPA